MSTQLPLFPDRVDQPRHFIVLSDGETYDLIENCRIVSVREDVADDILDEYIKATYDSGLPISVQLDDRPLF